MPTKRKSKRRPNSLTASVKKVLKKVKLPPLTKRQRERDRAIRRLLEADAPKRNPCKSGLPLNRFVNGKIRLVKKNGQTLVQFQKVK